MLKPGAEIQYTQSSISLETLIGKMVFSKSNEGNSSSGTNSSSNADTSNDAAPNNTDAKPAEVIK